MSTIDASIVDPTSSFKGSTLTYTVVAIKDTTMELPMDLTMDSVMRSSEPCQGRLYRITHDYATASNRSQS